MPKKATSQPGATSLARALRAAREHLDAGADADALATLLDAWRDRRSARIADVIELVSDDVTKAREPVRGKTLKDRTAAWAALASKKDPADVGRLLATPWPGTWKDALPVLRALTAFPDDPRIARALVELVDRNPYDTWTSKQFYAPLFAALTKAKDVRTLPLLEAQAMRTKSRYHREGTRPIEAACTEELSAVAAEALTLDPGEDEALRVLEERVASAVTEERAKKRGEAEFLQAIYAAPDDDGVRQVFADWLAERGDPRGEFVAIQLAKAAGRATDAMLRREASLLKQHGKAWAGPLDGQLYDDERVFERGFVTEGILLRDYRVKEPWPELSDAAWATVHALRLRGSPHRDLAAQILALPSLSHLRAIRGVDEVTAWALGRGPRRVQLQEIEFKVGREADATARATLAEGAAFPNVRHLGVSFTGKLDELGWLLSGALARRAERITLFDDDHALGPLIRAASHHDLPVRELVSEAVHGRKPPQWRFTLRRDDKGNFTRLWGEPVGASSLPSGFALADALATLAPTKLTELRIPPVRVCGYDADDIARIEARLARFSNLGVVEVPWKRVGKAPVAAPQTPPAPPIELLLRGDDIHVADAFEPLWGLAHEPPAAIGADVYEVNYGGQKALAADGLRHAVELAGKVRTRTLRVYHRADTKRRSLLVSDDYARIASISDEGPSFRDAYFAWVKRIVDAVPVERAHVPFASKSSRDEHDWMPPFYMMEMGWIFAMSPAESALCALEEIEALARTPGLEPLCVAQTARQIVFGWGDSPREIPDAAARRAVHDGLAAIFWRGFARTRGYDPHELAREVVGEALAAHGFKERELARPAGATNFQAAHPAGARSVLVGFRDATLCPAFTLRLAEARGQPRADAEKRSTRTTHLGVRFGDQSPLPARTLEEARAALTGFVERIPREVIGWFDEPAPKARARC